MFGSGVERVILGAGTSSQAKVMAQEMHDGSWDGASGWDGGRAAEVCPGLLSFQRPGFPTSLPLTEIMAGQAQQDCSSFH